MTLVDFIVDVGLMFAGGAWLVLFGKVPPFRPFRHYPTTDLIAMVGFFLGFADLAVGLIGVWLYGNS